MKIIVEFNERLAELMFDKDNMTTEYLAKALETAGSTIREWKGGKRNILLSNAIKLADYFNCSLDFLFGRSEKIIDFQISPALPFYEGLMLYMKKNKISRYKVVKETKLSNGNFSSWRKGSDPKIQTVIDLADYFQCSIDYLVGRDR